MSKIVKNIIAISVSSALSMSFIHNVNAATYQIKDKGAVNKLKFTYAQQQNAAGDMAILGTGIYNFPVQFKYLDEDDYKDINTYAHARYETVHELNDIEDLDALKAGTPTVNDFAWVVRWLRSVRGNNLEYQKVGDTLAVTNIGNVSEDYNLWDSKFTNTDTLTRSTNDILSGITNAGILYGTATAPYLPGDVFTDKDNEQHTYWLREHGNRGFFSYSKDGQVHQVTPLNVEYAGGESAVLDVNEAEVAVGFSSYKVTQDHIDYIKDTSGGCADTDIVPDRMPLAVCIATRLQSTLPFYHRMAIKATLNQSGDPVIEQLGLLVTPHAEDERAHSSYALAVNDNGVSVGYASAWDDETETTPAKDERSRYQVAVVYKNSEVIDLTGDHSNKANSRAYDINNAGIAVGHITKAINGQAVQKFFHIDTTVPKAELTMVNPTDFFTGSDSTARAINNAGLIVGEGEVETHNESTNNPRRTAAFVYDINKKTFSDLNKQISCAERSTYNIIEARGINDAGIISATAVVKVDRLDAKGQPMLDASGNPLREDVLRAISLEPKVDDGETCPIPEEEKVVRKGAAFGFGSLIALVSLFGLRRKFKRHNFMQ